ncbi:hypothetical protein X756_24575 [Mesorhizobium sp. LSHC412B00]|nr:hypothetical protein X756_24575 [Mesorhizobium sp. LSHC412B00]
MVEPDLPVAGGNQRHGDSRMLFSAGSAVGKKFRLDEALILYLGWDMRVAEQGKPVGAHGDRRPHCFDARLHRLTRQAVDDVEVDAAYSMPAQHFHGSRRLGLALDSVDRFLNNGIEALYAQARAVHAGRSQAFRHLGRECAWIDLDGDRSCFRDGEAASQELHQSEELGWSDERRRSAAEMYVAHGQRLRHSLRNQTDLVTQRRQIVEDGRITAGDGGWEAAIPAG